MNNISKRLIVAIALGTSLQLLLWLVDATTGRGVLAYVFLLVGIALLTFLLGLIYNPKQKQTWLVYLFTLLFAWPLVDLVQLVEPDWLGFCLVIVITVGFLMLFDKLFKPSIKRLWLKVGITSTVFVVWFSAASLAYLYVARMIMASIYS